ncbi:hypothetical protein ACFVZJ_40935 [Streptomyces sp. NPDC058322]|uniref:hypothetical protein n=1 Tax=unclassified Streptomyces TaxID=2593676 RepID=UPI0036EC6BD1
MGSPRFNPRTRRTAAEMKEAHEAALANRANLTAKYQAGTSMNALATESGVDNKWLRACFVEWGVPIRSSHKS